MPSGIGIIKMLETNSLRLLKQIARDGCHLIEGERVIAANDRIVAEQRECDGCGDNEFCLYFDLWHFAKPDDRISVFTTPEEIDDIYITRQAWCVRCLKLRMDGVVETHCYSEYDVQVIVIGVTDTTANTDLCRVRPDSNALDRWRDANPPCDTCGFCVVEMCCECCGWCSR